MSALSNGRRPTRLWRALIVVSDTSRQIALRSVLRETGLFETILSAASADAAYAMLDEAAPDLVLAGLEADGGVPLLAHPGLSSHVEALAGRIVVVSDQPLDPETTASLRNRPEVAMVAVLPLTSSTLAEVLAALAPRRP